MVEPAIVVEGMMARYDSLYADTSYRESDIMNEDGTIDADWRRVIERFPDRFMIGSDTWANSQWAEYRDVMEINRKWLSRFSRSIAESVAYNNAERLFERKVSNQLFGRLTP
jgi:predicted TIM-barrel fold metal-dependent hydrolase